MSIFGWRVSAVSLFSSRIVIASSEVASGDSINIVKRDDGEYVAIGVASSSSKHV